MRHVRPPVGLVTRDQHLADLREPLAAYTAAGLLALFDNADITRLVRIVELDGLRDVPGVPLVDLFAAVRLGHAGPPGSQVVSVMLGGSQAEAPGYTHRRPVQKALENPPDDA